MKILDVLKRMFYDMFCNNLVKAKCYETISEQDKFNISLKIAQYNLERIIPISFIIILFQLTNLIIDTIRNPYGIERIYCVLMSIILIIISLFFLWLVNKLLSAETKSIKKIQYAYRSFWVIFGLSMVMLSGKDLMFLHFPINSILFCGAVSIVPILSLIEITSFLLPNMIITVAILIFFEANLQIISGLVLIYIACFILSIAIHHTYINAGIKMLMHTKKIEQLNETLFQQSRQDCLTELLNRKGLEEHLEAAWDFCKKSGKNACMVFFDIDFFKNYNDTYGHYEGDMVIQKIAIAIKSCFKRHTDIVCRLGGEEFLVFLYDVKEADVLKLVYDVREKMKALKIKPGNPEISEYLTFSIGIAISSPHDDHMPNDLFIVADKALYLAKANGRNCVAYNNKIIYS